MHIGFLLGSPGISGGTNVIIEHGSRLCQMGHRVSVISLVPVEKSKLFWHKQADKLEWLDIHEAEKFHFDVLLATWWQSVDLLKLLKADSYIYFVQSIESRFFPQQDSSNLENRDINVLREWCERSYSFPIPVITEASWIKDYLMKKYNATVTLVRNGIRKDIYKRDGNIVSPRKKGQLRVLVEGPLNVFFKNVEKTIKLCRQSKADEIWLLTSSNISEYSGVDRCFSRVPIAQTAEIYRSCDVLVKLSYVEGMFGPPLEMFHCGGTAVVYDVTGHDEYIEHKKNALVVEKDDEKRVVEWLNKLKENPNFLQKLKENAVITAEKWPGWQVQAEKFANALSLAVSNSPGNPHCLKHYSENSAFARDNHFKAREYERMVRRERSWGLNGETGKNFIQVYYHAGEGFRNEVMLWKEYRDNRWSICSVKLPESEKPLFVRVDPSVRIGMVTVRSIKIRDTGNSQILGKWDAKTGFQSIHIDGTCQCFDQGRKLVLLAFGEDPQIHLPGQYKAGVGGQLELRIELYEKGLCETYRELLGNTLTQNLKKKLKKCMSFFTIFEMDKRR